jgi:hypothetical protein
MSRKLLALVFIIVVGVAAAVFYIGYAATGGRGNIPDDFSITLSRGPCFGFCPIYDVTVFADGSVQFEPGFNRGEIGEPKSNVSEAEVKELYDGVKTMDFFNLNDRYSNDNITDLPSATIAVKLNGKTKSIYMYGLEEDIPDPLEDLTELIDQTVGLNQEAQ